MGGLSPAMGHECPAMGGKKAQLGQLAFRLCHESMHVQRKLGSMTDIQSWCQHQRAWQKGCGVS